MSDLDIIRQVTECLREISDCMRKLSSGIARSGKSAFKAYDAYKLHRHLAEIDKIVLMTSRMLSTTNISVMYDAHVAKELMKGLKNIEIGMMIGLRETALALKWGEVRASLATIRNDADSILRGVEEVRGNFIHEPVYQEFMSLLTLRTKIIDQALELGTDARTVDWSALADAIAVYEQNRHDLIEACKKISEYRRSGAKTPRARSRPGKRAKRLDKGNAS